MKQFQKLSKPYYFLICAFLWVAIQGCNEVPHSKQNLIMTVESVEQAKQLLQSYNGKPTDFLLPISTHKNLTLLGKEVPMDAAMAIIGDQILKKGWMPNGFEERAGVRYYKFSK